jgi:hypothetical protein
MQSMLRTAALAPENPEEPTPHQVYGSSPRIVADIQFGNFKVKQHCAHLRVADNFLLGIFLSNLIAGICGRSYFKASSSRFAQLCVNW